MQELTELPFDLHELRLFLLVAEAESFSLAAERANLSASALTRQIQGLEARLGDQLLIRTTRSVRLTIAGQFWLEQARRLLSGAEAAWKAHSEQFQERPPTVRVGVCRTIALAYLPGFFHAYRRQHPGWGVQLHQGREEQLMTELDDLAIDVAILPLPPALPQGCECAHTFEDGFAAIGPADGWQSETLPLRRLGDLPYIALDPSARTGEMVRRSLRAAGLDPAPAMELDNYDLVINSVTLGLGYAIVPHRSLAIYARNRRFTRYRLEEPIARTLGVIVRGNLKRPAHLKAFIDSILF